MPSVSEYASLAFCKCSAPLYKTAEYIHHIFSPIVPGRFQQQSTKCAEIAIRIALGVASALMLIPSLPLHSIGLICRAVQIHLRKTPYFLRGKGAVAPMNNKLRIGMYNVNLFPGPMPTMFGGVSKGALRIDSLASDIQQANLDVLCIAEGHSNMLVNQLINHLDHHQTCYDIGAHAFRFNSGLVIHARYPIEDITFTPFVYADRQKMINKGFISFQTNGIRVIATHLDPASQKVRRQELNEITAYAKTRKEPVILAGDMNIKKASEEYAIIAESYTSAYNDSDPTCNDEILMAKRNKEDPLPTQNDIVDYILVLNGTETKEFTTTLAVKTNDDPDQASSDHALMTCDIEFA